MMTINEFTASLEELFVEGTVKLTPSTRFRDNDEFDSLIGYAMLLMIKDNFGYNMSVPEFLNCHTPEDLYKRAIK